MRTRPGLKSCLKITPPITPDLSAASSPCGSGRTSPSATSDCGSASSGGRKTVSFCSEDELEEVFWADEWDRTPSAVTPKLSYQDILELKQLRISLPYSPPPPTSREPFTTSAPSSSSAGSSSKPAFPVSRFAVGPSHTPSKWKNRSQPQVDPDILPYLDAVPIRLLPLLPQSPTEPSPPVPPEPHPQTPTPTASPERRPAPPPPIEPPEIKIEPAAPPSSPPSPVQTRKPNLAFLPLLPVQDSPPVLPSPVPTTSGPVRPKRTFNMTFLPVNAVPESAPPAPPALTQPTPDDRTECPPVGTSTSAPLPSSSSSVCGSDARSNDADRFAFASPNSLPPDPTPLQRIPDPPSPMSSQALPLPLTMSLKPTSGLESDNDTETDTTDTYASDTDVESDAPSTSTLGSSLPSPPLDDDAEVQARLDEIKLGSTEFGLEQSDHVPRVRTQDLGSYFPPVPLSDAEPLPIPIPASAQVVDSPPALPSGPGQTPPLSVLYPSPTSQHQPLPPLDAFSANAASAAAPSIPSSHPQPPSDLVDVPPIPILPSLPLSLATGQGPDSVPTTPLSMNQMLRKKLTLEALPSPALVPPSPFELEPLSVMDASPTPAYSNAQSDTASQRTLSAARVELGLASDASNRIVDKLAALSVADASIETPIVGPTAPTPAETPNDSPLLTLESMRAAWDAGARVGLGVGVAEVGKARALAPSLSRRRSS